MKKINIISFALLSAFLSACGGSSGSPDKPDVCKDLSIEHCNEVTIPVASSSSSASSEAPPVNNMLPLTENFTVNNATQFFDQSYKPLLNANAEDPNNAFYYATSGLDSGRIVAANGKLTIGNARFTLGQRLQKTGTHINPDALPLDYKVGTTTEGVAANFPTTTTWGDLDLAHKWKISFCVPEVEALSGTTSNQQFMIYVDNNTSSSNLSIHGTKSLVKQLNVSTFVAGKRVEINIPGDVLVGGVNVDSVSQNPGKTSSFIQLRVPSAGVVTMSQLWVGYQSNTSTEPAASTCTVGARVPNWNIALPPEAPVAPSFIAGSGQLRVNWPVAARATTYTVAWNTTNSVEGATLIEGVVGTSTLITGLQNGTSYYVFVKAVNTGGVSAFSPSAVGVPAIPATAPETPTGLTLYNDGSRELVIWNPTESATSYSLAVNTMNETSTATVIADITDTHKRVGNLVNDTPYYFFVKAVNAVGGSEYSAAKVVTHHVSPYIYEANLHVSRDKFFGLITSAENVSSSGGLAVQTITPDSEVPMHYIAGSNAGITLDETAGTIKLASGGRFTIGQFVEPGTLQVNTVGATSSSASSTSSSASSTAGRLNLSGNYKIYVDVVSAADVVNAGLFQVYVDNNTGTQGASIHGNKSRLLTRLANTIADGETIVIDVSGANHFGTANSFIQLRTDSAIGVDGIVISGIRIVPVEASVESSSSSAASSSVDSSSLSSTSPVSSSSSSVALSSSSSSAVSTASSEISSSSSAISSSVSSVASSSIVSSSSSVASSVIASSSSSSVVPFTGWNGATLDLFGASTSVPLGSVITNTSTAVTLTSKGGSLNSTNRKFYFASQDVTGDFVFTARLSSVSLASGSAFTVFNNNQFRFGVLATESVAPVTSYPALARFAELGFYTLATTPTYQGSRAYKLDVGGASAQSRTNGTWAVGDYLRIAKMGNAITLSTSADGVTYTAQNTSSFADVNGNPVASTLKVGFFAASGADELTLAFDNISITQ